MARIDALLETMTVHALLRNRILIPIYLCCIAGFAYFVRCLHLLNHNGHYYVISPDSYFFQWEAKQLLEGRTIQWGGWHTGITYPVAYAAKAISFIDGISIDRSLSLACMFVPPFFAVAAVLLIYFFVSRVFDSRVALFSSFAWAVAPIAIVVQAAGYLDRDCLSLVLVMAGAFVFHRSLDWDIRVFGRNIGWLLASGVIGGIAIVLYLEWVWLGPFLLLTAVSLVWVAEVLFGTARRMVPTLLSESDLDVLAIPGRALAALWKAVKVSNWRPLCVLLTVGGVAGAVTGMVRAMPSSLELLRPAATGSSTVSELQGITTGSLLAFNALLVAMLVGMAIGLRKIRRADSFAIGWFAGLFFIGLFAGRLFLYSCPALCVLSGVGFAYLFDISSLRLSSIKRSIALQDTRALLRCLGALVALVLIFVAVRLSVINGLSVGSSTMAAADRGWQDALDYLKENSDPDAVVMSQWSFGYYIRDLADRRAFVDNGSWDTERNKDVALAYTATDASEVAAIMQKTGVDYLVFSTDYWVLPAITEDAFGEAYGNGQSIPKEMRDSIYARSLSGAFISGGGISRVYPDTSVTNCRVVILSLD